MDKGSHILELLRGGVADKGDVIGVIDVRPCRRDIRKIIRERYLTVIACHFNLGLGLFQGLVVLDCHSRHCSSVNVCWAFIATGTRAIATNVEILTKYLFIFINFLFFLQAIGFTTN